MKSAIDHMNKAKPSRGKRCSETKNEFGRHYLKHTSNVVKEWLNRASIKVFELPSQCPDLNPHQDRAGCAEERSPCQEASKCNQIYQVCQEKWLKIQPECYTSIKVKTQCTQYMGGRTGEQKRALFKQI